MKENVKFIAVPIADGEKGKASVCAEVGANLYEDPDHANITTAEAEKAASEYAAKPLDLIEITGNWVQVN